MSTIKVTNLRHASATANNIALDSSNNAVVAGTLGCTGDLTVTSGNLVLSSGNGIDFSAAGNAAGMTSELLDDYEEGTFTPVLSATSVNVAYSAQTGEYTKIGRTVFFTLQISLSTVTSVGTGDFLIGGLPFPHVTTARHVIQTSNVNFDSTKYSFYAYNSGTSSLRVLYTIDNASWGVATTTDFAVNNGAAINVTGFYRA